MTRRIFAAVLAATALSAAAEPVTLKAADGVVVNGEVWRAANPRAPLIVAFHQAGSSHAEYTPIAARLNAAGYSVFAVDQRSGGDLFGPNATADAFKAEQSYESALPDLEAAFAWAKADAKTHARGAKLVLWGSSYSSSLIFVLAARHPADIAGLLSFSPGEYFDDKPEFVRKAAAQVTVPVFIDQASKPQEIAESTAILKAVKGGDKQMFVAKGASVHGSSTLRDDRNAGATEPHWQATMAFLRRIAPTVATTPTPK